MDREEKIISEGYNRDRMTEEGGNRGNEENTKKK